MEEIRLEEYLTEADMLHLRRMLEKIFNARNNDDRRKMSKRQQEKLQELAATKEVLTYPLSELLDTFPNALAIYRRLLTGEETAAEETVEAVRQSLLHFCERFTYYCEKIRRLVDSAKDL